VNDARWAAFSRKRDAVSRETERLRSIWVNPKTLSATESERVLGKAIEHEYQLSELLRRPDVTYQGLMSLAGSKYASPELAAPVSRETVEGAVASPVSSEALFVASVVEQVEISAKYSGYIERQRDEVEKAAHFENLRLPPDMDFSQVTALSFEARQKLKMHRPETLGQASRISGITPASISLLMVHLKKGRGKTDLAQQVTTV
jgi:tRNA uridine 5-carboxymethylaminomethyl modification enzyme